MFLQQYQKFGRLTVLRNDGIRAWCSCDCGNEREVSVYKLQTGHTKSCGCLRREGQKIRGKANTIGLGKAAANKVFSEYKNSAKIRNIQWNLTRHEFDKLTQKECHYCGNSPKQTRQCIGFNGSHTYNGIDRLDSNYDYSISNCVPCCKICNYAKGKMSKSLFLEHIYKVYTHSIKKLCL